MTADIIPLDRSPVGKEEYTAAITLWCQTRDTADCLTREEIGGLQKFDRVDALRKSLILNLAHYYRKHPRSDVAPGVAAVMTMLADNEDGAAKISQATLAQLFDRSVSSIADAQKRLREDGILKTGRGRYAATYPVIPRAVTNGYNHLTWLVSAACDANPLVNLPAGPVDCQSSGQTLELNQSSGPNRELKSVNHPVEPISINRPDPGLLHYKNSKEDSLNAQAREIAPQNGKLARVAAAVLVAGMSTATLPLAAAPSANSAHHAETVHECWQTPKAQMEAATKTPERKAQSQVWKTDTGRVDVAGDFRRELLEEFPEVDLRAGLAASAQNVNPDHGAFTAMQVIRRQFGFMRQHALRNSRTSPTAPAKQQTAYAKNGVYAGKTI